MKLPIALRKAGQQSIHLSLFLLVLFLHSAFSNNVQSQDISKLTTPSIINYNRKDYNASTQNWAITQDKSNIMWFGNHGRALWFDGMEWGNVPIPNGSVIRSLHSSEDSSIIAGGFGDFGEIRKNDTGKYEYISWRKKIPEAKRDFSDIWNILELNNTLFVQSYQRIMQFRDGNYIGSIEPQTQFRFSFLSNGRLYVEELGQGLKVLLNSGLTLVEKGDFFIDKEVWFLSHLRGRLLVGTQHEGAFIFENGMWNPWNTEANEFIKENRLFSAIQLNDEGFLFGTVQGGLILADNEGNITKIINKKRGLQDNTILSMFLDSKENLWLGLDRGIDFVRINYPFSTLTKEEGFGTGYAAIEYKNKLYLGTNQGIYSWSEKKNDFVLLENSTGQVWSFKILEDQLYCCHNNGIYTIKHNKVDLLFDFEGAWKIEKVPGHDSLYIAGCYNGLQLIRLGENPSSDKVKGFDESCRIFEFDTEGDLWMSHGYIGVYKLQFSPDMKSIELVIPFGKKQGLPSKINNEVFKYNDELIIAAKDGFYHYNDIIGLMQKYKIWNKTLPLQHPVSKVIEDPWGRINFFSNSTLIWAVIENDSLSFIDSTSFLPLKNDFFNAFENIYYTSKERAIIGTVEGFSVYTRDLRESKETHLPIFIKRAYCLERSSGNVVRREIIPKNSKIKLPYSRNNLYIDLSIPVFQNQKDIHISYKINNKIQTDKINNNQIILQNLNEGLYSLEIQAKDYTLNQSSDTILLSIIIMPPWYKKWYTILAYIGILVMIVLITIKTYRKRLEIVKRKEKTAQIRKANQKQQALIKQAEKAEKELILIRNEKLSSENRLKAEEIANSTMELVHKNKMLLQVKETLTHIQKEKDIDIRNSRIKSMLRKIDKDLNNEENWRVFERNFDEVHENFLNRLKEKHPLLTSKDLRLCAYLRMNLSSKEIAPLLRISSRSVEISRYRLRKKMDLNRDTNLSDYILSL